MKANTIVFSENMRAQEFRSAASHLSGSLSRYDQKVKIEDGEMVVYLKKRSLAASIKAMFKPDDSMAARHVIATLKQTYGVETPASNKAFSPIKQDSARHIEDAAIRAALHDYSSHDIFG